MKKSFSLPLVVSFLIMTSSLNGQTQVSGSSDKASAVIEKIIAKTGAATIPKTVDVIKEGNPDTEVKGIVTCMFATMNVLREAVAKKCNLIIAHEPLYYNHLDEKQRFQNDPVFLEKQKFIKDNNLVVWRFHDYIHSLKPDGIEAGMVDKLGWKKYTVDGSTDKFTFPEMTLNDLLKDLKKTFPKNSFNVVGNPEMKLRNVRLAVGAPGSGAHFSLLEESGTDVLIAGEVPQWETYEYARDAVDQGRKKAVVFLGHIPSEEAGMDYCATWLKGFIKDIPVFFVESGSSYWTY